MAKNEEKYVKIQLVEKDDKKTARETIHALNAIQLMDLLGNSLVRNAVKYNIDCDQLVDVVKLSYVKYQKEDK